MTKKNRITFAIPTRNRIDNLRRCLKVLVPQLDEDCELIILDNHSDKSVGNEIRDILGEKNNIHIVRNQTNVGACANVVRCFELCTTNWLFPLGDSRVVAKNIVVKLKQYIHQYPEAHLINYYYPDKNHAVREKLIITNGIKPFVKEMGSFGNIILVGNMLINTEKNKSIHYGYHYTYSNVPQFVIVLMNMNENSMCVLSPEQVIESFMSKPEDEIADSNLIDCWIRFSTILDLPLEETIRKELAKIISGDTVTAQPFIWFFKSILLFSSEKGNRKKAKYFFHRACSTRYYYNHSIVRKIQLICTYIFLSFPFLIHLLIKLGKMYKAIAVR